MEQQWTPIWTSTRGFRFDVDGLRVLTADDGSLHVAIATWSSRGVRGDGSSFDRTGRATIVLRSATAAPHGLAAQHSHFSEAPSR